MIWFRKLCLQYSQRFSFEIIHKNILAHCHEASYLFLIVLSFAFFITAIGLKVKQQILYNLFSWNKNSRPRWSNLLHWIQKTMKYKKKFFYDLLCYMSTCTIQSAGMEEREKKAAITFFNINSIWSKNIGFLRKNNYLPI